MQNFEPGSAENNIYRTGSTYPPKNYGGVVAVLLILVILLLSMVTILSLMNVHLFKKLKEQRENTVEFSETEPKLRLLEEMPETVENSVLGLTGQEITSLYRSYNAWPQGVYVSAVAPNGPAENADIRPGDIVIAIDSVAVSGNEDFRQQISQHIPGKPLQLTIFREQQELTVTLTVAD